MTSKSAVLPSVYAVTGSVQTSDFAFYQAKADDVASLFASAKAVSDINTVLNPVLIRTHQGGVGTISNYISDKDFDKTLNSESKSPKGPNIFTRDVASLSPTYDTVVVTGSIKFVNNFTKPSISDTPEFTAVHQEFVKAYLDKYGLSGLIKRYLDNIYNNAILWRNQYGIPAGLFIRVRSVGIDLVYRADDAEELAVLIEKQLLDSKVVMLDVAVAVIVGDGAEVFPSQPFADGDAKKAARGDSSYGRMLSSIKLVDGREQVILHSQKVGNALRRVDVWYGEGDDEVEPIAVEAYGAVVTLRTVHRAKPNSFFNHFNFDLVSKVNDEKVAHYVMAMLIKGGVLGMKG